jgi:hypothetical protein
MICVPSARTVASGRGLPVRESVMTPLTERVCAWADVSGTTHASSKRKMLLLITARPTALTTIGIAILLNRVHDGLPVLPHVRPARA